MDDPIMLVSADSHVSAPPNVYREYIESRYVQDLDALMKENEEWVELIWTLDEMAPERLELIDPEKAIRTGGEKGAWLMDRRIQELDREGVAGEILVSGTQVSTLPFFGIMNRPYPPELRMAGAKAHHRWLADQIAISNGRQYGIAASGPCINMDETIAELRWVADHGFVGISPPLMVPDPQLPLPPLYHERYEPFWTTCAELGLVINIHAGFGKLQGSFQEYFEKLKKQSGHKKPTADQRFEMELCEDSPVFLDLQPRRALWQIMLSGALDRYPNLRIALSEIRADWVPATLDNLDQLYIQLGAPMKKRPSEYFVEHCAVVPSSPRPSELALRHKIGVTRMMFGADYPHPEGTWPNTWDWIRDSFRGVPENEARLILGENAVNFYRLDRNKLAQIARRIASPRPSQLLGNQDPIDPRKIDDFHRRARYRDDPEVVDEFPLRKAFTEDVDGLRRSSSH